MDEAVDCRVESAEAEEDSDNGPEATRGDMKSAWWPVVVEDSDAAGVGERAAESLLRLDRPTS